MDAVALMVMEVLTLSSGIPSSRVSMSANRVDGHTGPPDFSGGYGVVGIPAHLRR